MFKKKYDLVVYIGRFQPLHLGHITNINRAKELSDNVLVVVGSSWIAPDPKNPLSFDSRKEMLRDVFQNSIGIRGVTDYKYNNTKWVSTVNELANNELKCLGIDPATAKVAILGFEKDRSSDYIRDFPQWTFETIGGYSKTTFGRVIDATKVRELYFEKHYDFMAGALHPKTFDWLIGYTESERYRDMVGEYDYYKDYHEKNQRGEFPTQFNCTDAVVVQGAHVLLIQRDRYPGKGLWAMPGGFVDFDNTCLTAIMKELREETRIKVPEVVLRNSITYEKLFDDPDRSLRGRTFTMTYLIELTGGEGKLPAVKGGDDARVAKWFTVAEVAEMQEVMFEDHYSILTHMLSRTS